MSSEVSTNILGYTVEEFYNILQQNVNGTATATRSAAAAAAPSNSFTLPAPAPAPEAPHPPESAFRHDPFVAFGGGWQDEDEWMGELFGEGPADYEADVVAEAEPQPVADADLFVEEDVDAPGEEERQYIANPNFFPLDPRLQNDEASSPDTASSTDTDDELFGSLTDLHDELPSTQKVSSADTWAKAQEKPAPKTASDLTGMRLPCAPVQHAESQRSIPFVAMGAKAQDKPAPKTAADLAGMRLTCAPVQYAESKTTLSADRAVEAAEALDTPVQMPAPNHVEGPQIPVLNNPTRHTANGHVQNRSAAGFNPSAPHPPMHMPMPNQASMQPYVGMQPQAQNPAPNGHIYQQGQPPVLNVPFLNVPVQHQAPLAFGQGPQFFRPAGFATHNGVWYTNSQVPVLNAPSPMASTTQTPAINGMFGWQQAEAPESFRMFSQRPNSKRGCELLAFCLGCSAQMKPFGVRCASCRFVHGQMPEIETRSCITCKATLALGTDRIFCDEHHLGRFQYTEREKEQLRAEGICTECRKVDAAENSWTCKGCREAKNESHRVRNGQWISQGICPDCREENTSGWDKCDACREKGNAKRRKRPSPNRDNNEGRGKRPRKAQFIERS